MGNIFEQLKQSSESSGEKPPIQALPTEKKKNWMSWLPVAAFAFAAVFAFILYTTEHALRVDAERGLTASRNELSNVQADLQSLQKENADTQKSVDAQTDEWNQKIQALESDKGALEKERDQYKEEAFNSQQGLEKLKQENTALQKEKQDLQVQISKAQVSAPAVPVAAQSQEAPAAPPTA